MVNSAFPWDDEAIPGPERTAMEELRDALPPDEFVQLLDRWAKNGGRSIDDEALRIALVHAKAERIAIILDAMVREIPSLMDATLETKIANQVEREKILATEHGKIADRLEAASKRLISLSGPARNKLMERGFWAILGAAASMALSAVLFQFFLSPAQLKQARAGDGPLLEWLATADGQLLRKTFKSGNTSLQRCVDSARENGVKTKSKKIPCLFLIDQ